MIGWDVPGQRHAAAVLQSACARGDIGHAWAFLGMAGVGQERLARTLTAALNCPNSADGVPDGSCSVCARCARGAYPGYYEFAPGGTVHRVVDVREQWLTAAFRTALEGDWKVLRVVDADRMNEPAANAFLKGLEEPPPRTVWVLDVADPDELPDTILSRCRIVRCAPWGRGDLDAEAGRLGLAGDDRALAVRAACGSPATLTRLAAPGGLDDLRAHRSIPEGLREQGPGFSLIAARRLDEEAKRRTAELKAEGREELAALAELYGDAPPRGVVRQVEERAARREREARLATVQAALDDLVGWYRDCLLVQAGGSAAGALGDEGADLQSGAAALTPAAALTAVERVLSTRTDLELNLAQGLALEALFLDLAILADRN